MSRFHGSKDLWLSAMRADGSALRSAAGEVDPAVPVPSRPQWTMRDLLHHLGSTYRWVNAHATRGVTAQPDPPLSSYLEEEPAEDIAAWWDVQFAIIITTLDALDADAPAWNWAPQAKRAGFWHRRTAHETAIHRWDAQFATINAEPIEPKLAADGISEVLDTWLPAGRRKGPTDVGGVIRLSATDLDHDWLVRLRPGGGIALLDIDTLLDTDEHRQRAAVRGSASDLLLVLYGRIDPDVLDLVGDERLLEGLRTG